MKKCYICRDKHNREERILKRNKAYYQANREKISIHNQEKKRRLAKETTETRRRKRREELNYPTTKKELNDKIEENLDRLDEGLELNVPLKILNGKLKGIHFSREYRRGNKEKINQYTREWCKKKKKERRSKNAKT